jgi:hypothetical protein
MLDPFGHKVMEHAVMVPLEAGPIAPFGLSFDQSVDHGFAVGTAISVVADKDNLGVCSAIRRDKIKGGVEHINLAVNVADSIDHVGSFG